MNRTQSILRAHVKNSVAFLSLLICLTGFPAYAGPKKTAPPNTKSETGEKVVEFERIAANPPLFKITNNTDEAITLDSLWDNDAQYPYAPAYDTHQYLTHGKWVSIPRNGDVPISPWILTPGKSVTFEGSTWDLVRIKKGTLLRLRIGKLVSKSFRK